MIERQIDSPDQSWPIVGERERDLDRFGELLTIGGAQGGRRASYAAGPNWWVRRRRNINCQQCVKRLTHHPGLGASGRSPTKRLWMVKRRARAHGRRLSLQLGWFGSGRRSVLGCAPRVLGGELERRPGGV